MCPPPESTVHCYIHSAITVVFFIIFVCSNAVLMEELNGWLAVIYLKMLKTLPEFTYHIGLML
jgi:hypothetical protein